MTLNGPSGPLGSYTHEWHDGMESRIYEGMLTRDNTVAPLEANGFLVTIQDEALAMQIRSATIESGLLKTPGGMFVMDTIDIPTWDATVRDP
ncbi:MAG: hypothetical protein M5U28_42435 [Sandaracinaceae bacterium]|nr:hypothetical protein [Sandaracinaceae bacterium]